MLRNILTFLMLRETLCFNSSLFLPQIEAKKECALALHLISKRKQIIALDLTDNSYLSPQSCLFKRTRGHSILNLADNNEIKLNVTNKTLVYANFSPNVIIITANISTNILAHPILRYIFRSHRSYTFFEIKSHNDFYKCYNGKFNVDAFAEIENFLNTLWQKFLLFRVILRFHITCPDYFVVYDIKTIQTEKKLYNRTVTTTSAYDVNRLRTILKASEKSLTKGYPIRVNIFERFPTSIYVCDKINYYAKIDFNLTHNFCGLDAFIMQDVVTRLGFNVTFPVLPNVDGYGYAIGENVTGSLGYLIRNGFDISFNSRFLVKYLYGEYDTDLKYMHYVTFDSVCALMKTPEHIPLWHFPYGCFNTQVWAMLIAGLTLIGVVAKLSAAIEKKINRPVEDLYCYDYITIGLFGWILIPKKRHCSILRATCLIASIIILSVYQGHINYVYTTSVGHEPIKTIKDLIDNNVEIYTSPSITSLLGGPESLPIPNSRIHLVSYNLCPQFLTSHREDISHFEPFSLPPSADLLEHNNYASLQRKSDIQIETLVYYKTEDGKPRLGLVDECFGSLYLSHIARSDFPFSINVIQLMLYLVEAGLPEAYYRWTKYSLGLQAFIPYSVTESRMYTPTNMSEQRIAFGLLWLGYIISTCSFIMERWLARRKFSSK
ncbi:hypothetical protein ACJJTC_003109 [Scirpophaga incertulas]